MALLPTTCFRAPSGGVRTSPTALAPRLAVPAFLLAVAASVHAARATHASEPATLAADLYAVGMARVDITPTHPVRLGGFGNRRAESEGVTGRIHARALAIGSDSDGPAVLVAIDITGIPTSLPAAIVRRLARRGVRPERLAITVTHSHAAPMVSGYLTTLFGEPIPADHQRHIDRYTASLIDSIEAVCVAALDAREPARLSYGVGEFDLAKNRRLPDGLPVDHDLPVLVVKSPAGAVRATWTIYACHAVILGHNSVDGDWPGYAADTLEREMPGTTALVSIGCGADQNPDAPVASDQVDVARREGARLAEEVRGLLRGALRPVAGPLSASLTSIELPLRAPPDRDHWKSLAAQDGAIGHHARMQLAALDRGDALPTKIDYPVQTWRFGDSLAIVFLSGEVVVDYAARIKREFDRQRVLVVGYTNGVPCYIPSERVLGDQRFAYENSISMRYYNVPAPLASGVEQRILDEVVRRVPEAYRSPLRHDTPATAAVMPLTPRQSLRRLRAPAGLSVEVVAAEPLTTDPVAIDFGPDGRLWVCEMGDYPAGLRGNFEPGGRIRVLRDDDGDGTYDRSTVFLDGLSFPTGVTVWRDGVLVCAAPDILFAADTDGDDRADVRRTLFTGFGTGNYQARVNGLAYGLDGWVHGSCGLFGGDIRAEGSGRNVPLGNRDFRIDPDAGLLEPLVGTSQQGRVRNDDGDWFGCTNSLPMFHIPLSDHRGPAGLAPPPAIVPVANGRILFPRAEGQRFKRSGSPGGVTAACGLGIYRDDWLEGLSRGDAIVCEPVNLVLHREHLAPTGTTFVGARDPREASDEFLTSTDGWFRPVQVRTGPDGGLWVVDMSRAVIEHPRWIPEDVRAGLDIRGGDRQGRILRIIPAERGPRPVPRLDRHSAAELVAALRSPNGTVRDLAQQLLLWRSERGVAGDLAALVGSDAPAAAQAAAIWILARWESVDRNVLERGIASAHGTVRRHALRVLAAHPLPPTDTRHLLERVDVGSDPRTMLAALDVMRAVPEAADIDRIVTWLTGNRDDEWLRFAALRAVPKGRWANFVGTLFARPERPAMVDAMTATITLAGDDAAAWNAVLSRVVTAPDPPWHIAEACAAARAGNPGRFAANMGPDNLARWESFGERARVAFDEAVSADARGRIAGTLADGGPAAAADMKRLLALLSPQTAPSLQSRLLAVLFRDERTVPVGEVLDRFASCAPAVRGELLERLVARPAFVGELLTAIEAGTVPPYAVDAQRRQLLLSHRDPRIAERAATIFGGLSAGRADVLSSHRDVLGLVGDASRGRDVVLRACVACHAVDGQGHAVGPNLSESRNKPWSAILEAILDPNRAVDMRYATYVAVLADGRTVLGLLASETDDSITLKGQEGRTCVVSRRDIDELSCAGRSLMPEGLEKDLSHQDLADVCAFMTGQARSNEADREGPAEVAARILDDRLPAADRNRIVAAETARSAELIAALAAGLGDDSKEEYRRIAWLWKVAIAAGKRNDLDEMRGILRVSLPAREAPLADWQAVVVGGGIVNGITLAGDWPHERIAQTIGGDGDLRGRWDHAVAEAVAMADREETPKGTRYDALRMIAMLGWQRGGGQLRKYLGADAHKELQMGAVSGLADIPAAEAVAALIDALPALADRNRDLAIDGLLRSENRMLALLDAVAAGRVPATAIDPARRTRLLEASSATVRARATTTLAPR